MTKNDLIQRLEIKGHLTYVQAEAIVDLFFDTMITALHDNERIEIRGFGSFVNKNYRSYTARNPKSGKTVLIPAKKVPFFKAGKDLKKKIDENRHLFSLEDS